jgi:AMP-binding enzyme/Acetyl-coenzyme A synthetase N-terminus
MTYQQLYDHSVADAEGFWREKAQAIHWFKFPKNILTKDKDGLARWFKGGKLNTCYLAVDNHVENGRGEQVAIFYDSPATGVKKQFTYRQLQSEVARFAGVLRGLGVEKDDRVIIYMPMVAEVAFAMLACARLGAVHSVVFGGFAAHELAIRIDDATPKVLLMASGGKEFDKIIPYKPIVDKALDEAVHKVKRPILRGPSASVIRLRLAVCRRFGKTRSASKMPISRLIPAIISRAMAATKMRRAMFLSLDALMMSLMWQDIGFRLRRWKKLWRRILPLRSVRWLALRMR